MNKEIKYNLYTYFSLLIIACIGIIYGNHIIDNYFDLRIWGFSDLLIILIGIPFLFLLSKANIPDFWQFDISNKKRLLNPFLIGLFFGLLDLLIFKIILHPEPYDKLPLFLQPFPYSIFLYLSGAFEIEIFYRLIPITVFCLIGIWIKKGAYFKYIFLFAAVITSIREPLEQLNTSEPWLMTYSLITGFLMNLFQALYFKRAGFVASLSLRLGHYFLWHILLGIYVQYIEL